MAQSGYTNPMRKDTLVIAGVAVVAIVIGVSLFFYGGDSFSSASPSAVTEARSVPTPVVVSFTELARGAHSKVLTRTNYLITSTSEFEKLWQMVDAKGKAPVVDFTKDSVVAVFAGQVMTGGYSISVSKVTDAEKRTVAVILTSPGSNCIVTQSTNEPYQIIKVPKTSLTFTHEDQTSTTNCSQ